MEKTKKPETEKTKPGPVTKLSSSEQKPEATQSIAKLKELRETKSPEAEKKRGPGRPPKEPAKEPIKFEMSTAELFEFIFGLLAIRFGPIWRLTSEESKRIAQYGDACFEQLVPGGQKWVPWMMLAGTLGDAVLKRVVTQKAAVETKKVEVPVEGPKTPSS